MIRSSIVKRLDVLEECIVSGIYILVFCGLPPIHVQITTGSGANCKTSLRNFSSVEEIERFLDTHYPGVKAMAIRSGDDMTSADLYECSL